MGCCNKRYDIIVVVDRRFDGGNSNRAFRLSHFESQEDAGSKKYNNDKNIKQPPYTDIRLKLRYYSTILKQSEKNIYSSGDHKICTGKLKAAWPLCNEDTLTHSNGTESENYRMDLPRETLKCATTTKQVLNKDMLNLMTELQKSWVVSYLYSRSTHPHKCNSGDI